MTFLNIEFISIVHWSDRVPASYIYISKDYSDSNFIQKFSIEKMILFGAGVLPIHWLVYIFMQYPNWIIPTQILGSIAIVSSFDEGVSFLTSKLYGAIGYYLQVLLI